MPTAEQQAQVSLTDLREDATVLVRAQARHDRAKLRFIRDARRAAWSWTRIGDALGQTDVAVRRYWERNRHAAGRAGRSGDASFLDRSASAT